MSTIYLLGHTFVGEQYEYTRKLTQKQILLGSQKLVRL